MKILVTGAAGYLGSVLVPHLMVNRHEVTVVDNFMYGQTPFNNLCHQKRFDVVRGDVRDDRVMKPLLAKADVIIPLAAIVGMPACEADRIAAQTINTGAIHQMVYAISDEQRVLMPITNSGYGIGEIGKECTEDTPMAPISHYGRTKVAAEKAVLERAQRNSISFRLATVFGMSPRMRIDLLVNDFVYRAVNDRALVLFEAAFIRNYIHIRDVARVFAHGIERFEDMKGRAYNVGLSSANLSKLELCERIKAHVPGFYYAEAPIGEDPDKRDYIVSNARIEATGWLPRYTLDDGILEMIKGYRMIRNTVHGNI